MIIADKIVSLRKRAGWSQEELAEKLGVTRQSVSKWEGAQSVPDMDKVVSTPILVNGQIFSTITGAVSPRRLLLHITYFT